MSAHTAATTCLWALNCAMYMCRCPHVVPADRGACAEHRHRVRAHHRHPGVRFRLLLRCCMQRQQPRCVCLPVGLQLKTTSCVLPPHCDLSCGPAVLPLLPHLIHRCGPATMGCCSPTSSCTRDLVVCLPLSVTHGISHYKTSAGCRGPPEPGHHAGLPVHQEGHGAACGGLLGSSGTAAVAIGYCLET